MMHGASPFPPISTVLTDESSSEQQEIAALNPLLYRGYYYDFETGYYYLQSRYYNPNLCRFINSDVLEMSGITKDTEVCTNMFAYCNNDPVNNDDPIGHFTLVIIAGVAISASSIAALFALFAFATLYATSTTFRNAVNSIINLLIKGVVTGVKTLVSTITLVVKIAKKSRKYKGNEVHHIVAKSDRRAAKSRAILKSNKISVNDKCNLVSVKKTFHKHLHRNTYHSSVYSVLKYANKGTKSKRKARIQGCLVFIGYVLKGAGKLC